jgi:hypothetical protein
MEIGWRSGYMAKFDRQIRYHMPFPAPTKLAIR